MMATVRLLPLADFKPESFSRAWISIPNPNGLPLIATATSDKTVRVFSLENFTLHSTLEGGHTRAVRSVAWKPTTGKQNVLTIATGSFDATMGIWRRREEGPTASIEETNKEIRNGDSYQDDDLEVEITRNGTAKINIEADSDDGEDWEFAIVLEGHDSEIKSVAYSLSGQWLASCSRDKSIWVWEEIGDEGDDEFETVAVLQEHTADVKCVCWRKDDGHGEVLASASYDDTIRLWREDGDGEWESIATLEGHEGTVWSLDWGPEASKSNSAEGDETSAQESDPLPPKTARLISASADHTVRVWSLSTSPPPPNKPSYFNSIPSTMRRPVYETWTCIATLPSVHDLPVYSVSWSKKSGRVVSAGGDGRVAVYEERNKGRSAVGGDIEKEWVVLCKLKGAHGPYEINHVTWCTRFDTGKREVGEEMIVTTGDDGAVKAWMLEEDTTAKSNPGEEAIEADVDAVMQEKTAS